MQHQDSFQIPELPTGKVLEIRLLSNWGDPTHIGLNSIEIFSDSGRPAVVEKITSNASETTGHIESLLSESRICKDAEKMWSANMIAHNDRNELGEGDKTPITLKIELEENTKIAMIRFWNYNASRVRAQIGIRHVEMLLDSKPIFRGEIDCSFSSDAEFEPQMGDTVLFTTDDKILESIAEHDICLIPDIVPSTSNLHIGSFHEHFLKLGSENDEDSENVQLTPYRPTTCESKEVRTPVDGSNIPPKFPLRPSSSNVIRDKKDVKVIHIELLANWGMRGLIGLTGIEIVDQNNQIIELSNISVTSSSGNQQFVKRLLNGQNLTRNQEDMWLTEFNEKDKKGVTIAINFSTKVSLKAISIWNYNSNFEMSYAGAKVAHIYVNGQLTMRDVLLRKATGFVYFDYVQDIAIDMGPETAVVPTRPMTQTVGGFVFQIRLLSTWGDEFYIGLNGIELYGRKGGLVRIKEHNLAAFPESVNILPSIQNDLRVSNNLINGINDTDEARYMWLTPVLPNRCARVFFVFDVPTYISRMVIYNYRKTPERGVRHVSISVDDLIIFSGEVPASTMDVTAKLDINLQDV